MPNPPSLSPKQREAALEKAAAARRVRAETKDQLKMGLVSFDELLRLADSDDLVGKMKTHRTRVHAKDRESEGGGSWPKWALLKVVG